MQKRTYPKTYDIVLGNLPPGLQKESLARMFGKRAQVESVSLVADKKNEGANLAFVRFGTEEDAEKMLQECNQMSFDNHKFYVGRGNYGREKERGNGDSRMSNEEKPNHKTSAAKQYLPNEVHQRNLPSTAFSYSKSVENNIRSVPEIISESMIMPTYVNGPTSFWGQHADETTANDLQELSQKLQIICPSSNSLACLPPTSKVYATKFSDDNQWYRCIILKHIDNSKSEVLYMDYGNGEIKENNEIVELPCNLSAREPFAQKYSLFGLTDVDDVNSKGHMQGRLELEKLINWKVFSAKVCRGFQLSEAVSVILQDGSLDVNQAMLDKGFAKRKLAKTDSQHESEREGNQNQQRPPQHNIDVSHRSRPTKNYDRPEQCGLKTDETTYTGTSSQIGVPRTARHDANSFELNIPYNSDASDQTYEDPSKLNMEVHKLKRKLIQSEQEKEQLLSQIRTDQNKLQTVCESYRQITVRLLEADMSTKIKHLIDGVKKVRTFRHMFPTDDESCRDNIDYAIEVLSNKPEGGVVVEPAIIQRVYRSLENYKAAQDGIRNCDETSKLENLVSIRDDLRESVYDCLLEFHNTTTKLQVDLRIRQLQDALESLLNTHESFLKYNVKEYPSLEEAVKMYNSWKEKYLPEFKDIRTLTNTRHNAVDSSIQLLQQQLSLDVHGSTEYPSAIPAVSNLEVLFIKFQEMINVEIAKTTETTKQDSMQSLGTIVHLLVNTLKSRLDELQDLQMQTIEFQTEMKQVEPWLKSKPDSLIANLQDVRKQIRNSKSKIRHRLADLLDVEENDCDSRSDLTSLKEEITALRTELQEAYQREDSYLCQIPQLCEKHFPELKSQYPSLSLEKYAANNGLVKMGWSLNHYDMQDSHTQKSSISRSTFCGRPVVLKGHLVDECLGVTKEEFIKRVTAYSRCKSPNLMKLEAVFFEQNTSQAYIQMPYYERNLTSVVKSGPVSIEWTFRVLKDILSALHALHNEDIAHGAIHPDNVFINFSGRAILAECNFLKYTIKAKNKTFVTDNGLKFAPPEPISTDVNFMKARDVYNFGVLALWMHYPQEPIKLKTNGLPDTSPIQLTEPLAIILQCVVQELMDRKTVDYLTKLPHFSNITTATSPRKSEVQTLQLRHKAGSPTARANGGILKKYVKNGNAYEPDERSDDSLKEDLSSEELVQHQPSSLLQKAAKVLQERPNASLQCTEVSLDQVGTMKLQTTEFSPIVSSLPCSPMGTPGNTPTEVNATAKDPFGNSPRQNIVKTLEKITELVESEGTQDIVTLAEDELPRDFETDDVHSDDGTITEEDCDDRGREELLEVVP